MKRYLKILLAILSGLLLSPAYLHWGSGVIMFVALIPLLLVEQDHYERKSENRWLGIFWYPVITFFIFNLLTISWVRNAAWIGVFAALIINTSVMTAPFLLFHYIKRSIGPRLGYVSFIVLWVGFEFLYLNGQINFPWLVFGNAFANNVALVQWYEITGVFGGSVWVLVVNILLTKIITRYRETPSFRAVRGLVSWTLAFLLVPVIASLIRFYTYDEEYRPYEFVVLQPNIDPYMKFQDMPQEQQTYYLLEEARKLVTDETDYIIGPETFINNGVWHSNLQNQSEIVKIKAFLRDFPKANFIIGASTLKRYTPGDEIPDNARPLGGNDYYYQSFNSALQINSSGTIPLYHKSKLVAGVEFMPTFGRSRLLKKLVVDLGGITRSHGVQDERETFASSQDGTRVGPVICWESIFGEYVTHYVTDAGAEFLAIITNDGWWGDTPGHRQHNSFAHLRAIETRRSIARSANTGISTLIDQRGKEIARLPYWERGAIKGTLNASDHITFYARYGDYIARISLFLAIAFLLYAFVRNRLPS
jgi:apolipoprotein N-acyltransferase